MIVYYALGGGLGHITRAQAIVHTLGRGEKVRLVCSGSASRGILLPCQFELIEAPAQLARDPKADRSWLVSLLEGVKALYVDAFVGGLAGELCGFECNSDLALFHVARRLRWDRYAPRLSGPSPRYERCFVVEELEPAHARYVEAASDALVALALEDYPRPLDQRARQILDAGDPFSLLVHSGSAAEICELIAFACEVRRAERDESRLYLVAPARPDELPDGVHYSAIYPAQPLFAAAHKVFSACGFNLMRQMRPHRHKHRFLPFARSLDDQYARARLARQELGG